MKRFNFADGSHMFVGEPEEIGPVYRSLTKAFEKDKSGSKPMFCDTPKFNSRKLYGLMVDQNNMFYVISEHVALSLICHERVTL